MTKRLNSKHKVDRRLKVNLWGRPKSPFNTRAYGPGQHGQSRSSKPSDYGIQLQAKQKLKSYYGNINERQFRNIYKKAIMKKGDSAENLIGLLERRLDAVVYRAKLSTTIFSARQLINHGHVKVNGKKVNISSYQLKEEATVEIKEIFKITKVGKVAGCMVLDGKINKDSKVRLIREGIIIYTGDLGALKRYKDEVKEVVAGMECGLSIKNYNDIKVGDIVEAFTRTETARKL